MDVIELTKELCNLRTVTHKVDPGVVDKLERLLKNLGYFATRFETNEDVHFLASIGTGNTTLAFVGHYDVVDVDESWNTDPFKSEVKDGLLYARGACDMKAGLAAALIAGKNLAQKNIRSLVYIAGDEEDGSLGAKLMLEKTTEKIDYVIGGEPTAKNEVGDVIKIGRRAVYWGKVSIKGVGGHGAYPKAGKSSIDHLPEIIQKLQEPWSDSSNLFPATSIAVTGINSENKGTNVIPSLTKLIFDARISPNTSIKEFELKLKEILGEICKFDLETLSKSESYIDDSNFKYLAQDLIKSKFSSECHLDTSGGTSDARFFGIKGIPTIEIGTTRINMHAANEAVPIKDIKALEQIYIELGLILKK